MVDILNELEINCAVYGTYLKLQAIIEKVCSKCVNKCVVNVLTITEKVLTFMFESK